MADEITQQRAEVVTAQQRQVEETLRAGLEQSRAKLPRKATTPVEAALATTIAGQAKKVGTFIKGFLKELAEPYEEDLAKLSKFWTNVHGMAKSLEADARAVSESWLVQQEEERAAAQRIAQERAQQAQADREAAEARARQAETPAARKEALTEAASAFAAVKAAQDEQPATGPVGVRTEGTTATLGTDWEIEVTDIAAVPEKFVVRKLALRELKAALRAGHTLSIPGLKITEKKKGRFTTARRRS